MEKFIEAMAELLEVDAVSEADVIQDFEAWDSLTSISIIAFVDETYHVAISNKDIIDAKTIGGLRQLVMSRAK